jgi:hypothetical protein
VKPTVSFALLALLAATSGACRPHAAAAAARCETDAPVCGRDGNVYRDACVARTAGVPLAVTGHCPALVPGWAPCGAAFCDARTSYCEIFLSDVPELPTGHYCRPLPAACHADATHAASCSCLAGVMKGPAFCGQIVTGGLPALHVTWQSVQDPAFARRTKADRDR